MGKYRPGYRPCRLLIIGCLLFADVPGAPAASDETLQFFEEEAQVITASRRKQSAREAPMSVEVITADEIRASGALNLWDLMRFRAGMDVLENRTVEGNRAVVTVRGIPVDFITNLLVLVDGRSVYNQNTGGVLWEQLPVQIQDIERIEIVRGPNAALFGPNAGSGVINIITKEPESPFEISGSGLAGSMGGDRHLLRTEGALEHAVKRFHYRVSYTHRADDGFPNAGGGRANDFLFSNKGNFRGSWDASDRTHLDLFSGASWDTTGAPSSIAPDGMKQRLRSSFGMAKITHGLGEDSGIEVSASGTEQWTTLAPSFTGFPVPAPALDSRYTQYDADILHHFSWLSDRMNSTWGGSWRQALVYSDQTYPGAPRQENDTARGYTSHSLKIGEKLTALGAVSIEHSDLGGWEPAYQVALLDAFSANHLLRISHSLAPSQPQVINRSLNIVQYTGVAVMGDPGTALTQRLWNYEIGYQGDFLAARLRAETNLYYMHINHQQKVAIDATRVQYASATLCGFEDLR